MTTFRYRALTPNGEVVSGSISALTAAEVAERVEYLGLIPIETVRDEGGKSGMSWNFTILSRPRPEDVTIFTGDLALLLQTGARINDALELLAADADIGARLAATATPEERFAVIGREIYGWHPEGIARSRLAILLAGRVLKVTATARNWTTVTALLALTAD